MDIALNLPSPIERVDYELFKNHEVKVFIKRDDLIHADISGNKWRKLKLNIEKCRQAKYDGILTFGGAYSNHISATAALGKALDIHTIGIIRGEELTENSNATLQKAATDGMQLEFVNREEYSWRYERDYKELLRRKYGNVLVIEEGGANYLGVMGCTEIINEVDLDADYFILPTGTGTTTAGLLMALDHTQVIGVPVFKNGDFIREDIAQLLEYAGLATEDIEEKMELLVLATEYSFGGYGRFTDELVDFINHIFETTGIRLDQIYTGKMFYALCDYIKSGKIPAGSTVVVVHTGGLQGTSSIKERLKF